MKNTDFSIAHESINKEADKEVEPETDTGKQMNREHEEANNNTDNMASLSTQERNERKRKMSEVDAKMIKFMDQHIKNMNQTKTEDSRHLLFFKGLLPSLESLNDEQTLEFQSGVLNLLQNIKKKRTYDDFVAPYNYGQNSNYHHWQTPENTQVLASPSAHSSSTQNSFADTEFETL